MNLHQILHSVWTFLCRNYSDDSKGHSYGQPVIGSFIMTMHMSPAEVFGETSNHPRDSGPLQPRFDTLWLLTFPKIKITFEREKISDRQWDSGKYNWIVDGNWENCVRSQGTYFEGDGGIIVVCTMFLVSYILFNKCLFFILYGWVLSGQTSHMCHILCIQSSIKRHFRCLHVLATVNNAAIYIGAHMSLWMYVSEFFR